MLIRAATVEEAAALAPYLPATHVVVENDRLVGGVCLTDTRRGVREVSLWVVPAERRRGVATRTVRTLAGQADQRLEMIMEIADTVAQRVALNAGFTREAVLRESRPSGQGRHDDVLWARLPGDPPGPARRALPDVPGGGLGDGAVTLRPLGVADADDLFELRNLPDVRARSMGLREPTRADVMRRCEGAASHWLAGDRADFTIRVDGALAGDIGLYNEAWSGQAMIGYSMLPRFRGRGVATRAVRLLAAWAFEIGVRRLIAGTAPDNTASQRVLAKVGFVREGVERSRFAGPDGDRVDDVVHVLFPR